MEYKALMLDVDGTLIPYNYQALPSEKVVKAIEKAREKVTVCLVTGRGLAFAQPILQKLQLHEGYAVINNGALVVKLDTQEVLYDRPLEKKDAQAIALILKKHDIPYFAKRSLEDSSYHNTISPDVDENENTYTFFTDEVLPLPTVEMVFQELSQFPHITLNKSKHKHPELYGFDISHADATKLHGIEILMKTLGLKREEIIGVGDGYNDFPLLMACGLKVAIGNAVPELKAIADYVAPPVTEDGVADVIEKYILTT